jgi:hypothetical protein
VAPRVRIRTAVIDTPLQAFPAAQVSPVVVSPSAGDSGAALALQGSASNLRMAGPFLEMPVISQISASSFSGSSTVIFIFFGQDNRIY